MKRSIFVIFLASFFLLISVRSFDPAICMLSRSDMKKVLSTFSVKQAPVVKTYGVTTPQEVADHGMHTSSE